MHSLPTQHYADGEVGELLEYTKHFWSWRGVNIVAAQSNTIEINGESFFGYYKTYKKT